MLEWQNESSLFTIRIQGKQWYWSYKYNSDTNYKLNNVYINVGNNNWMKYNSTPTEIDFDTNDSIMGFIFDYEFRRVHTLNLEKYSLTRSDLNPYNLVTQSGKYEKVGSTTCVKNLKWLKDYRILSFYRNSNKPIAELSKKHYVNSQERIKPSKGRLITNKKEFIKNSLNKSTKSKFLLKTEDYLYSSALDKNWKAQIMAKIRMDVILNEMLEGLNGYSIMNEDGEKLINYYDRYGLRVNMKFSENANLFNMYKTNYTKQFESDRLDEFSESSENLRNRMNKFPVRLIRGVINKHNAQTLHTHATLDKNIFFNYKIVKHDTSKKIFQPEQFWGFRQKRFRKLRSFHFPQQPKYNSITYTYLKNFLNDKNPQTYQLYTAIKNNKYKNESIPVTLARRLLRTKRTLVLPAHINITLITNSYDVVHSWFVPGLGLKIDCVPGRSTHHTLYIDNVGFYYGQCAEICGRYHHHMPIRVCALPYEHFILWWQTRGLPRMYRSKLFSENKTALLTKFKQ